MSTKINTTLSEEAFNGVIHVLKSHNVQAKIPVVVSKDSFDSGCTYTVEIESGENLLEIFKSCAEEITALKTKIGAYEGSLLAIKNMMK